MTRPIEVVASPGAVAGGGATGRGPDAPDGPVHRTGWQRAVAPFVAAIDFWRRSLRLRVVVGTMVLSALVVLLASWLLMSEVSDRLLNAKTQSAVAEVAAGMRLATASVAGASGPGNTNQMLTGLTQDIANQGGSVYDVVLEVSPPKGTSAIARSYRVSNGIEVRSVPDDLEAAVLSSSPSRPRQIAYRYTTLYRSGAGSVPALAMGYKLVDARNGANYGVYYLFPLNQEEQTLLVVRGSLVIVDILLIVLLGLVAWLVTHQVVNPVRAARRIAERFAAGRLEERMRVRGKDDMARLATSFNQMATSLQRQIQRLEDLSRVQRRFVSDVSHELRTPLTTVRMAADVLHEARTGFDPAAARAAELLQAELDRFEALLTDLLEISRFDAGAAVLDVEEMDLRDVVRRVVDANRAIAQRRDTQILLDLPVVSCMVAVDPRRIARILRNLVVNAVEHGEGRPVVVTVAADSTAAAVTVRDHGIGLKPGEAALVFDRFWRGDPARARTTGGTGLGLAIALEDAHLHGGWLQAFGEPGRGAQFRLTLPRRVGELLDHSPIPLVPGDLAAALVGGLPGAGELLPPDGGPRAAVSARPEVEDGGGGLRHAGGGPTSGDRATAGERAAAAERATGPEHRAGSAGPGTDGRAGPR